jgi:hypothetical protein
MDMEERTARKGLQEPVLSPEYPPVEDGQQSSSTEWKIVAVLFVLLLCIAAGYGWLQHNSTEQLVAERADLRASLAQAKAQEDALTLKVDALTAAQEQQQAAAREEEEAERAEADTVENEQFPPRTFPAPKPRTSSAASLRTPVDDPRWQQVEQELGDQQKQLANSQKQIADTQANLQQARADLQDNVVSARTGLGSDIAHNHDEVVALETKGERTYYEFSFEKSKAFHHTGPISISLRKTDAKHDYCDLQMVVDDKEITRKHVNLYESVTLFPEAHSQPLELVINHIDKDSVQGYLSEPRFRPPVQAVAPAPTPTSASAIPIAPHAPELNLVHRDANAH